MSLLNETQIEAAARKLCELRGLDPDAPGGVYEIDFVKCTVKAIPEWEFHVSEIRAHLQVQEAIASVTNKNADATVKTSPLTYPVRCKCKHPYSAHLLGIGADRCSECRCTAYREA